VSRLRTGILEQIEEKTMPNTILPRVPRDEMSEAAGAAFDALHALSGDATFVEVFAKAPELLNFAMVDFYQKLFFEGRVVEKYKQLSRLRLSMNHGCQTCNRQNVIGVADMGYSQQQIDDLWKGDYSSFSEDEQAVVELADEIALNNREGELKPDLYAKLRRHFSEEDILELGMCLGIIVGLVKLSFTFGLVDKESYCEFGAHKAA
jgi:alkylhydroperoxidase family enzyme